MKIDISTMNVYKSKTNSKTSNCILKIIFNCRPTLLQFLNTKVMHLNQIQTEIERIKYTPCVSDFN